MAPRLALLAVLLLIPLSGCSDRPLAATAQLQRPSAQAPHHELPETSGSVTVTSLPVGSPDGLTNCFYVATDPVDVVPFASGAIRLEWTAEATGTSRLAVTASNGDVASASTTGSSPLWLNWTSDDGPRLMPFMVHVAPAGPEALTVSQDVSFLVRLDTDAAVLQTAPASC